jgi:NHS family xanthosine MFS transporter
MEINRWFWMIIMSCVVYGMAFDFFNISGSLFVETNTEPKKSFVSTRVILMMTNGFGAVLGSFTSGWAIDKYFTKSFSSANDLAGFLETETTNPKMLEFIKTKGV